MLIHSQDKKAIILVLLCNTVMQNSIRKFIYHAQPRVRMVSQRGSQREFSSRIDDEKNKNMCQDCRSLVRAIDRELGQCSLGIPQQMPALNETRLINESSAHTCPVCQLFLKPFRDGKTSSMLLGTGATSHGKFERKHLLRYSLLHESSTEELDEAPTCLSIRYSANVQKGDLGSNNKVYFIPWGTSQILQDPVDCCKRTEFPPASEFAEGLSSSTGSIAALNSAKAWLENCLSSHTGCHPSSEALPSRLVDTGPGPHISLRLVEKAQMSVETCYLTLSHCWGKNEMPIRLLRNNLASFKQQIPFTALSPVFQDAIKVVKHLGYRYLWVDSLCIIQDSVEDWKIESGLMGAVYSGSTCNLAATARPDGSKSLFLDRDTSTLRPLTVQASTSCLAVHDIHFWQRSVEDSPLWRRAWVCQELLLACRNIHFGAEQLFWE